MNKKGVHVDWAISMGIFLIYIIGMFILLRPGITPVHKPAGLLEILESNFVEEVMWEVREIPLFIEKCILEVTAPCTITIDDDNFKFSNFICKKGDCKENVVGSSIVCDGGEKPNLGEGVIFETTYHLKKGADKKATPQLIIDYSTNDNEDYCLASLGASISKKGINEVWLNNLKEYNELKKDWNFPDDKEFAIYKFSGDDLVLLNGAEKEQGINIFTKEIKTNILKNTGVLEPVTISLQVW